MLAYDVMAISNTQLTVVFIIFYIQWQNNNISQLFWFLQSGFLHRVPIVVSLNTCFL